MAFQEDMMGSGVEICAICAWREACQKKFSLSGKDIRCPDFVRDISVQKKPEGETDKGEDQEGSKEKRAGSSAGRT
jgi:hypothetical protein